jgi:hypothetical protein
VEKEYEFERRSCRRSVLASRKAAPNERRSCLIFETWEIEASEEQHWIFRNSDDPYRMKVLCIEPVVNKIGKWHHGVAYTGKVHVVLAGMKLAYLVWRQAQGCFSDL